MVMMWMKTGNVTDSVMELSFAVVDAKIPNSGYFYHGGKKVSMHPGRWRRAVRRCPLRGERLAPGGLPA